MEQQYYNYCNSYPHSIGLNNRTDPVVSNSTGYPSNTNYPRNYLNQNYNYNTYYYSTNHHQPYYNSYSPNYYNYINSYQYSPRSITENIPVAVNNSYTGSISSEFLSDNSLDISSINIDQILSTEVLSDSSASFPVSPVLNNKPSLVCNGKVKDSSKQDLTSSPKSTLNSKKTISKKNQLPEMALDLLNEWFDEHFNNPYPTLEDKERLAKSGGITVKQVSAWFSNRRNRSQNTKPKRMKRELEKDISSIFQELVQTNDSQKVIEKFRNTFTFSQELNLNLN